MKWFYFRQNNPYGRFDVDPNLTVHVFIEAQNVAMANAKLVTLGGYFDGVEKGIDCNCCGDRWHEQHSDEGIDAAQLPELAKLYEKTSNLWVEDGEPYIHYHHNDGTRKSVIYRKIA